MKELTNIVEGISNIYKNDGGFISKKELSNKDTIEITSKQIEKIKKWSYENGDLIIRSCKDINNQFNKIIIRITGIKNIDTNIDGDMDRIFYFKIDNQKLLMTVYYDFKNPEMEWFDYANENVKKAHVLFFKDNYLFLYKMEANFNDLKDSFFGKNISSTFSVDCYLSKYYKEEIEKVIKKDMEHIMVADWQVYFFILIYSQLNQESIIRQTRIHTKKIQSKKDKRKGKKPRVKLIKQNIIRLNTGNISEPTEEEIRHYERHTFGWTVRGHWRTYQSGKKVWIKPQIRGDKDKVEGKIYEI